MDGEDVMGEEGNRHRDFLVSMTSLSSGRDGGKSSMEGGDGSSTDARFKLSHGNDDCPITEGQALSDLLGEDVTIDSLLKTAKEAAGDSTISKDVAKTLRSSYQATIGKNKGLRLEAPASSVQEAKIGRLATHKKFTQQMTKWDAAVHSRRAATQVSYPLVKPDLSLKGAKDSAIAFKNQTPLEIEVAKLLYGSKVNQQTTDESGNSVGLSVREMREKLNDLAKIRAHEAYQQTKLKRQNKIKSKKYRRQLRKERKKELEAKEGATDDKKEEADLARAKERASLKHTKASKSLHFVAKHKDNSGVKNQILAEKDRKKRELKARENPSSSEEEEGEAEAGGADSGDEVQVNLNGDQIVGAAPTSGSVEEAAREAKLLEMVQANAEKKKAEAAAVAQKNLNPNDFMQVNVKSQNFADADSSDEGDDFEGEEGVTDSRTKIAEAFANDDDILRDFKKEAQEKAKAKRALNKRPADMPGWKLGRFGRRHEKEAEEDAEQAPGCSG